MLAYYTPMLPYLSTVFLRFFEFLLKTSRFLRFSRFFELFGLKNLEITEKRQTDAALSQGSGFAEFCLLGGTECVRGILDTGLGLNSCFANPTRLNRRP